METVCAFSKVNMGTLQLHARFPNCVPFYRKPIGTSFPPWMSAVTTDGYVYS